MTLYAKFNGSFFLINWFIQQIPIECFQYMYCPSGAGFQHNGFNLTVRVFKNKEPSSSFRRSNKIDKPLARLINRKDTNYQYQE